VTALIPKTSAHAPHSLARLILAGVLAVYLAGVSILLFLAGRQHPQAHRRRRPRNAKRPALRGRRRASRLREDYHTHDWKQVQEAAPRNPRAGWLDSLRNERLGDRSLAPPFVGEGEKVTPDAQRECPTQPVILISRNTTSGPYDLYPRRLRAGSNLEPAEADVARLAVRFPSRARWRRLGGYRNRRRALDPVSKMAHRASKSIPTSAERAPARRESARRARPPRGSLQRHAFADRANPSNSCSDSLRTPLTNCAPIAAIRSIGEVSPGGCHARRISRHDREMLEEAIASPASSKSLLTLSPRTQARSGLRCPFSRSSRSCARRPPLEVMIRR